MGREDENRVKIAVISITDGRQEMLVDTIESAFARIRFGAHDVIQHVGVNDSGDPDYAAWLDGQPWKIDWTHHPARSGLAAAIRTAWASLDPTVELVLHLEDDLWFDRQIRFDEWIEPFRHNRWLAQVCLMRGPQAPHEAAGILSCMGEVTYVRAGACRWAEQSRLFSLQPNIYPAWVTRVGWPEHGGEREFTDRLLKLFPKVRFAYLGWGDPQYEHRGYGQRMPGWQV